MSFTASDDILSQSVSPIHTTPKTVISAPKGDPVGNAATEQPSSFSTYSIRKWLISIPSKERSPGDSNYQNFSQSNYIYFFGGRLRTARTVKPNFGRRGYKVSILPFSVIGATFPMVLYLVYEAKWLWHHISPAIVIIFVYCWCILMWNLLKAALMDPGTLPRNIHLVDNVKRDGLPQAYHNWIEMPGPKNSRGEIRTVYAKYCNTCYIWRPVRAAHCSRCNVCVANLDHHCPWMSNCIGQRNYVYFIGFLVFAVITCCFLMGTSFYIVSKRGLIDTKVPLFLGIFAAFSITYPGLLLFYHFMLGMTGITTREYINAERHEGNWLLKDVCLSAFNSGRWGENLKRQWFRPKGLSNLRVIEKVREGDERFEGVKIGEV